MNDETDKLRRQLEAATAPGDVPEETLDAETGSLRQGWVALDRLLEAAEGPLSEPGPRWRAPVARRPRRWRPATVAAVAVAASLLLALALAWSLRARRSGDVPLPSPKQIASPIPAPPAPQPVRTPAAEPKRTPSELAELEWDDSLDEQLVSAGEALVRVQQQWYAQGSDIDYVRYGLNQIEEEFNDGSL